jgi:hypothetical protein
MCFLFLLGLLYLSVFYDPICKFSRGSFLLTAGTFAFLSVILDSFDSTVAMASCRRILQIPK